MTVGEGNFQMMPNLQGDGTLVDMVSMTSRSWYELGHLLALFARQGGRLHHDSVRHGTRGGLASDPLFCGGQAEQVPWVVCSGG